MPDELFDKRFISAHRESKWWRDKMTHKEALKRLSDYTGNMIRDLEREREQIDGKLNALWSLKAYADRLNDEAEKDAGSDA